MARRATKLRLAWRAWRLVAWVRFALWRWPYARVRERLVRRRLASRRASALWVGDLDVASDPATLAWAVRTAARRVPFASCLTQALALDALLTEVDLEASVVIGVARRPDGSFEAHAWVEHEGRVLIGGVPDLERFSVLPRGAPPLGRL
jgi:hypothetical protein